MRTLQKGVSSPQFPKFIQPTKGANVIRYSLGNVEERSSKFKNRNDSLRDMTPSAHT